MNDPLKSYADKKSIDDKYTIFKQHADIVKQHYKTGLGSFKYSYEKRNNEDGSHHCFVTTIFLNNREQIGTASAPLKQDSKERAAQFALRYFKLKGIEKPIPKIFKVCQTTYCILFFGS